MSVAIDARDLIDAAAALARPFSPSPDCSAGTAAAALLTAAGHVYTGVCVDTPCSLGFCAEHAAVAEMLKAREADVRLIVAVTADGTIIAPCGRCRELLWQVSARKGAVGIILGSDEIRPLSELLPQPWR